MLDMCSKPIFCSKIALKGKTCSRLLKPQKVAPNAKSCSKVAEHNRDRPTRRLVPLNTNADCMLLSGVLAVTTFEITFFGSGVGWLIATSKT